MKKTKIILLAMLGTCLISLLPAVLGTANVRPISDFTATNDNIAAWADPESQLTIFPHGWYVYGFPSGPQSIADCMPSGSVLEKDLKDGRIMYKVDLHVKGALMVVANNTSGIILVEGEMDYHFQVTMIIYDGALGDPVPNLLQIWFPGLFLPPGADPIGEYLFSHFSGTGTGTFLVDALGYTAGDSINAKVNQVGLPKPEGHPFYPEMWPVEIIFFH
ncbi:MAG: hypothetical protein ACFE96_03965 [Candidatus Hermodarchaeota archaeon]